MQCKIDINKATYEKQNAARCLTSRQQTTCAEQLQVGLFFYTFKPTVIGVKPGLKPDLSLHSLRLHAHVSWTGKGRAFRQWISLYHRTSNILLIFIHIFLFWNYSVNIQSTTSFIRISLFPFNLIQFHTSVMYSSVKIRADKWCQGVCTDRHHISWAQQ